MNHPGLKEWGKGLVWAEFRSVADGKLITGTVTVTLPILLTNAGDDAIIPSGKIIDRQPLNVEEDETTADGQSFSFELPATDDPDIEQGDWGWTIEVDLPGHGKFVYSTVPVPLGGSTNLRTLVPSVSAAPRPGPASLNLALFPRYLDGELLDGTGAPIDVGEPVDWAAMTDVFTTSNGA